ncbi:membrane bound lytic murein transglycosylase D (plasmid) [Legionella adelaidensis]|uniref:Membrane bound lytic murein transglycosylase D n=1 Tax=Legionella adelaidensis TaxID=45056 RepID=A0A0W0R245_9GAMM|nr:membrane bound lytic murein transglycosylase D [Legionella adelaidensis]VEH85056.1 membrane bound lytic murein transglycosylase D [Legionella adelaidensis]
MKFKSLILNNLFFILLGFCLITPTVKAQYAMNVWDVVRKEFRLNHSTSQPEVQNQLLWLVSHPSYLRKLAQSEPYIYHIVTEIKKRHLPGELALIPMIESAYDPFAYSGAGAAGLWQLMPGTGTDLGLKRDWWYDGRRSIGSSTDAALNYLSYLNNYFSGDWLLAIAAYDSGEGTIAKSIKNSPQRAKVSFWSLPVPEETRAYIPRLLALAEIIQNPQRYKVELPDIPHVPYFEEVNIGSQIDLNHAAKLAGISYKELIKLNPGFNRWATPPYRPYKLLIPADKVEDFSRNLANLPEDKRVSLTHHQVSAGDNLVLIAQKYHTTVNLIKELNQLKSNSVKKGQSILIPSSKNVVPSETSQVASKESHFIPSKQYKIIHIVQKNDSLASIEKKYEVKDQDIRQWNKLAKNQGIRAGQQLIIWKHNNATGTYIVKKGDSLSMIAKLNHTKVNNLLRLNPQLNAKFLKPGQQIQIG